MTILDLCLVCCLFEPTNSLGYTVTCCLFWIFWSDKIAKLQWIWHWFVCVNWFLLSTHRQVIPIASVFSFKHCWFWGNFMIGLIITSQSPQYQHLPFYFVLLFYFQVYHSLLVSFLPICSSKELFFSYRIKRVVSSDNNELYNKNQ